MRPTLNYLSAACAATALLACSGAGIAPSSGSGSGARQGAGHAPGTMARAAAAPRRFGDPADQAYLRGRAQHLAGAPQQAIDAYQTALAADPAHISARNGLATVYAEQGKLDEAISLWRALTDAPLAGRAPDSAFLFSNLGYAYELRGQHTQAVGALERACLLDPLNHQAWRHLGSALEQLGQAERAQAMYRQAASLETHDLRRDFALAAFSPSAAIDPSLQRAARLTSSQSGEPHLAGMILSEVRETSSGIFELRRGDSAPPPAPDPAQRIVLERATLEIRNGNGVSGMARALARGMREPNLKVVRLSNQHGFGVARTRVEYRGEFQLAATLLAERFGGVAVLAVGESPSADLRLVIGRDLILSKLTGRHWPAPALAGAASRKHPETNDKDKAG